MEEVAAHHNSSTGTAFAVCRHQTPVLRDRQVHAGDQVEIPDHTH